MPCPCSSITLKFYDQFLLSFPSNKHAQIDYVDGNDHNTWRSSPFPHMFSQLQLNHLPFNMAHITIIVITNYNSLCNNSQAALFDCPVASSQIE